MGAAPSGEVQYKATPVTVNYPAGLGTSVSANFNGSGDAASLSTTVSGSESQPLTWNTSSGVLMNGQLTPGSSCSSIATPDTNIVFDTNVANASSIQNNSTITLTKDSTCQQSVWYTVSMSGTVGADGSSPITQAGYNLTQAEKDNIFAINANKIPSALNIGADGVGKASESDPLVYTTAVGGTASNNNASSNGTAVAQPNANNLKTGTASDSTSTNISLSQNYLPLGITANVKDTYFKHNGIIWHYHNWFAAGDANPEISIIGQVNAYIGGTIQIQNSGAKYLSIKTWTNGSGRNAYEATLANGMYDNGMDLTSVGSLSGLETYGPQVDFYGIHNEDLSSTNQNIVCYPYVSLFGGGGSKQCSFNRVILKRQCK